MIKINSRIAIVGRNGAGKSTLLGMLSGELRPMNDAGEVLEGMGGLWRHRNLRLSYIAQHHMFHLEEFQKCTPLVYIQKRFRFGYDEEAQERLIRPQTPEEEQLRKEAALKYGKRSKEVEAILSRQKKGKELVYE